MAIEIKHRHTRAAILTVETETLAGADLREADLRCADLRWADLSGADLSGADLSFASLSRADLPGASLKNGETLERHRPVAMLGPVGSRGDFLVCYRTNKGLLFDVGCQRQIDEKTFRARLARDHSGTAFEREYLAALEFFKAQGEAWKS